MTVIYNTNWCLLLVICVSTQCLAVSGQAPRDSFLVTSCGMTPSMIPTPGSDGLFILPMQRALTAETNYAYYRFGSTASSRPPLVLIIGANSITGWGVELLRGLSHNQEVIIFDPRGQGFSEDLDPSSSLTIEGLAEDAFKLIQTIGLKCPNVLGWSVGGMIATTLAAYHPQQVGKIIVVTAMAGSMNSVPPLPEAADIQANSSATPEDTASLLFPIDTAEGLAAACNYFTEMISAQQSPRNTSTAQRQANAGKEFFLGRGVWDILPQIPNDFLLVGADEDDISPPANVQRMNERLRNSELVVYPAARHGVIFQYTADFVGKVESFLSE